MSILSPSFRWLVLLLLPLLLWQGTALAQIAPLWDRDYGGSIWEELNSVEETADGGFVLAGFSSSGMNDGDVSQANRGVGDYWVVKTDIDGNLLWDARFGGSELDRCNSIQQTSDGGYILGGTSASGISGEKGGVNRGIEDYWVIKIDANGILEWEQTYGGDDVDFLSSIAQTTDGGYLLGGRSRSGISGEKSEANIGDFDHWVIKIDALGVVEWDKTLGGIEEERLNMVQEAPDGDFLLAGSSRSDLGNDIGLPLLGVKDFWFLKVSALDGNIVWERRYGGTDEDELISFEQTSDNGFILAGGSRSDISVWKSQNARGIVDMWVIKTDALGAKEWDGTFGGANLDNCYSIKENTVGHFLLGGFSGSDVGIDKSEPNIGGWDYWLVYLNENGEKQWDKTFGGDANDVMFNLFQTSEGGYILAGNSSSDVSGNKTDPTKGLNDYWMIKTVCDVTIDFADTIVCPFQPVVLDAYNDANCPGCVWNWSDIGIGDSIRTILPLSSMSLTVTLTDRTGCQRSDDLNITVLPAPDVTFGADPVVCQGTSALLDADNSGLGFEWSTGEMTQTIAVDSAATYHVTITDSNGCTDTDSTTLHLNPLPEVDLGDDHPWCENVTVAFNGGTDGTSFEWSPSNNNQQIVDYIFTVPTTVSVTVTDNNNCVNADTVVINEIYTAPDAVNIVLECEPNNNFYQVSFDLTGGDPATYFVTEPFGPVTGTLVGNSFISDSIPIGQPYFFSLRDDNACPWTSVNGSYDCACVSDAGQMNTDPIEVCGNELATVLLENASPDDNDVVEYLLHDGDNQTIGTILSSQNQPGFAFQTGLNYGTTYFVTARVGNDDGMGGVSLEDGCLSVSEGVAITFFPEPTAVVLAQTANTLSCTESTLVLSGASSQPFGMLDFQWSTANGGNITSVTDELSIELDQPGTYILTVNNQLNSCIDTAHFEISAEADLPVAIILPADPLTCIDSMVGLDASNSSQGATYTYLWEGGMIDGETMLNQTVVEAGIYSLTVTNTDNGCSKSTNITVMENRDAPLVDAGSLVFINCDSETAMLDPFVESTSPISFQWTDPNGAILSTTDLDVEVTTSGVYELEVTSSANGCSATDVVTVSADPNGPNDAIIEFVLPACYGEANGTIRIDSVIGGEGPYAFAWENSNFFSATADQLIRLEGGNYALAIQDANGCIWKTEIFLDEPNPLLVNLGNDESLFLGDDIRLNGIVLETLDTFFWSPTDYLSCVDCLDPVSTPLNEVTYELTVVDTNNCHASDRITLFLQKERNIYIPSAFSPNGDGTNDLFTIYTGKGVAKINYVRVFNRWGALVYEENDIEPTGASWGWNGKFNEQAAADGVYVYIVEVSFTDDLVKQYQGDVTLVR